MQEIANTMQLYCIALGSQGHTPAAEQNRSDVPRTTVEIQKAPMDFYDHHHCQYRRQYHLYRCYRLLRMCWYTSCKVGDTDLSTPLQIKFPGLKTADCADCVGHKDHFVLDLTLFLSSNSGHTIRHCQPSLPSHLYLHCSWMNVFELFHHLLWSEEKIWKSVW